jgi:hypothetical protein
MTASPEPTEDTELLRLQDAYGHAEYEWGMVPAMAREASIRAQGAVAVARTALLAYHAATYVRRDANRLPPSPPGSYREARGILPWRPGDELPEVRIRRPTR